MFVTSIYKECLALSSTKAFFSRPAGRPVSGGTIPLSRGAVNAELIITQLTPLTHLFHENRFSFDCVTMFENCVFCNITEKTYVTLYIIA